MLADGAGGHNWDNETGPETLSHNFPRIENYGTHLEHQTIRRHRVVFDNQDDVFMNKILIRGYENGAYR